MINATKMNQWRTFLPLFALKPGFLLLVSLLLLLRFKGQPKLFLRAKKGNIRRDKGDGNDER